MKKLSVFALAGALMLGAACTDLSDVYSRLDDHEARIKEVEGTLKNTTQTANGVKDIVDQLQKNVYVSSVEETSDKDGYVISFTDGKKATIKNGKNGIVKPFIHGKAFSVPVTA